MTRNKQKNSESKVTGNPANPPFFVNGYVKGKPTRHGLMLFNPKDFHGHTLDHHGEMAYYEIELLSQLIKPGFVVLDVGANIGTHTLSFARLVGANGLVFSFEPQRLAFEFLCANILINNHLNVFPMMAGVSDRPGDTVIPILDPNVLQNAGIMKLEGHASGDQVRVVTIDSLKLARCNLIKIDVEGMEKRVLLGAAETIQRCRPFIFVENNDDEHAGDLIGHLTGLNYTCYWAFTRYQNTMDMNGKAFKPGEGYGMEINMLCLPAELHIAVDGLEAVMDAGDTGRKALARILEKAQRK